MQKVRLYSSKKLLILFVTLSVLLASMIFYMSNEPAVESADRSGKISEYIASLVVSDIDSLPKEEKEALLSNFDHIIRKITHFCIYATLGALLSLSFLYRRQEWYKHVLFPLVSGALYAASDEIHQSMVPGRGPLLSDVFLDSAGVLCGIIFILLVMQKQIKKSRA